MDNIGRDTPSTKARAISSQHLRNLMHFLYQLEICGWYGITYNDDDDSDEIDWKSWKQWVIHHTPQDKRGGPSPKSRSN